MTVHTVELLSYHEIRVGQTHGRLTRPKIRVGLVLYVLHGSGAYAINGWLATDADGPWTVCGR